MPSIRRPAVLVAVALALAAALVVAPLALRAGPAAASTADERSALVNRLAGDMSQAGNPSGAYVLDGRTGDQLFTWNADTLLTLASNTKLWTTGAVLSARGPHGTIQTRVLSRGKMKGPGILHGNLFLRGAGDPTFGDQAWVDSTFGGGPSVEGLARKLWNAGLREVRGSVIGDESRFDSLRGGPTSGYAASGYIGAPLTALAFDHGIDDSGHFQSDPPQYAADRFAAALGAQRIRVDRGTRTGRTPNGARVLARVRSLPMGRIVHYMDVPSDNWDAEELAKGLGGAGEQGTTARGAQLIMIYANGLGFHPELSDGSGLSHSDVATPHELARFLQAVRTRREGRALHKALPVAGMDGTLADRMTSGPAYGRCAAKTGTLTGVSALSGYCHTLGGHTLVFSILMNGVPDPGSAHSLQDDMAQAIADYRGQ
ncbi:MAG: D-alanyl-D-alanine carboxypeptidase/D-alanyl-D-alanine-endopeptidase [Actinobacteria bacterium]|nr:D-alanyl-D-alanine carboxypeptidase/D-alanyl-D-alanine-endopeptidase [Actinomycetota bacterium]